MISYKLTSFLQLHIRRDLYHLLLLPPNAPPMFFILSYHTLATRYSLAIHPGDCLEELFFKHNAPNYLSQSSHYHWRERSGNKWVSCSNAFALCLLCMPFLSHYRASKGGFTVSVVLAGFFISFIFYFLYQAFRNHGTHVLLSLIPKEIIENQMIHRSLKESQMSICSCRCSHNLSCHHQLLLHDGLSALQLYFSSLKVKYHLCNLVKMEDTKLML